MGGPPVHDWDAPGALAAIAAYLRADGVVALPTETLYGLSCRARSVAAVERVMRLKGIERRRGFVALVADAGDVDAYVAPGQDRRALEFLRRTWPTPLTAVLAVSAAVPWGEARGTGGPTAAFRVPDEARLRELLRLVGEPVLSTSANRTGEPPLRSAAEIAAAFGAGLDLAVVGVVPERAPWPSTLADFTGWPPKVLRPGAFDLEAALASWQDS